MSLNFQRIGASNLPANSRHEYGLFAILRGVDGKNEEDVVYEMHRLGDNKFLPLLEDTLRDSLSLFSRRWTHWFIQETTYANMRPTRMLLANRLATGTVDSIVLSYLKHTSKKINARASMSQKFTASTDSGKSSVTSRPTNNTGTFNALRNGSKKPTNLPDSSKPSGTTRVGNNLGIVARKGNGTAIKSTKENKKQVRGSFVNYRNRFETFILLQLLS